MVHDTTAVAERIEQAMAAPSAYLRYRRLLDMAKEAQHDYWRYLRENVLTATPEAAGLMSLGVQLVRQAEDVTATPETRTSEARRALECFMQAMAEQRA